jgi:hypothetical protein
MAGVSCQALPPSSAGRATLPRLHRRAIERDPLVQIELAGRSVAVEAVDVAEALELSVGEVPPDTVAQARAREAGADEVPVARGLLYAKQG